MRPGVKCSDYSDPRVIESVCIAPKRTIAQHRAEFDNIFRQKFDALRVKLAEAEADIATPRRKIAVYTVTKRLIRKDKIELETEVVPAPADPNLPERLMAVMARLWSHLNRSAEKDELRVAA